MKRKLTNKQRVVELFKQGKTLYFSDISVKLSLDLKETVDICKKLFKEGKIQIQGKKK